MSVDRYEARGIVVLDHETVPPTVIAECHDSRSATAEEMARRIASAMLGYEKKQTGVGK